jgi:hypothetical protein
MHRNVYNLVFILCVMMAVIAPGSAVFPQGIGVNPSGASPHPSSGLDVDFTDKGMLVPRLSDAERNALSNPAEGLLIFNTTTKCFNVFAYSIWMELCPDCINPPAPVAGNSGAVCEADTLFLYASSVPGAVSYYWTGPNGFTSTQQNPVIPSPTAALSGTFSVYAANPLCSGPLAYTTATIHPLPDPHFNYSPAIIQPAQPITFSPLTPGATYQWTFQGGTPASSTAQNPVVSWPGYGSYAVDLTVTLNGCTSTYNGQIDVVNCIYQGQTVTFNYTGSVQNWTVPAGVCLINVDAYAAQGGLGGGLGARTQATLTTVPGEVLNIYIGGQGSAPGAGWNGGGTGGSYGPSSGYYGGGGGGATDIRRNGTSLSDRILVAGGGGGSWRPEQWQSYRRRRWCGWRTQRR